MSNGGVDITQLLELAENLESLKDEIPDFCEQCAKNLAARLLTKVIKRTPVGEYSSNVSFIANIPEREVDFTTQDGVKVNFIAKSKQKPVEFKRTTVPHGGTLRNGWTGGIRQSAHNFANTISVIRSGDAYIVIITNNTEYASYVEDGHRTPDRKGWVKGVKMLKISEEELNQDAEKILEKKLEQFMRKAFKE